MARGNVAVFRMLNQSMTVKFSFRGLPGGIMSRTDRKGKWYYTIADGKRHDTLTIARNHLHRHRRKLARLEARRAA